MSTATPLETLFDKVKTMFIDASKDGKLEPSEVLNIAFVVVKDVCLFKTLSLSEKKGLVLLSLQRGLSAAGSLKGFAHVDPSLIDELERQVLNLAVNSVFGAFDAVPQLLEVGNGLLSYVRRFLSKYLPFCSQAAEVVSAIDPKDGALISEAVKALQGVQCALQTRNVEPTQVSQNDNAAVAAPVAAAAVPAAAPAAVAPAAVAPAVEVPAPTSP